MRKSLYSLFLGALILSSLWLTPVRAQERKGSISGRVMDANQGALVN